MSLDIPIGTRVIVSDGTPRPPLRHTKKLNRWDSNNYQGVVTKHNKADDLIPYDSYDVADLRYQGYVKVTHGIVRPETVTVVEGQPLWPMTAHGTLIFGNRHGT